MIIMYKKLCTTYLFLIVGIWCTNSSILNTSTEKKFIIPSLFNGVPPYIRFIQPVSTTPTRIPPEISKYLRWPSSASKVKRPKEDLVHSTLLASGHILLKRNESSCTKIRNTEILGRYFRISKRCWPTLLQTLPEHQKIHSAPSKRILSRKDQLQFALRSAKDRMGKERFKFLLPSFVLPKDQQEFQLAFKTNNYLWISKPTSGAYSKGISLVSRSTDLIKLLKEKKTRVVQKYVDDPFLYQNLKVEVCNYVLVTSFHPLRIFMFHNNLNLKLGHSNYTNSVLTLSDPCIHTRIFSSRCDRTFAYETIINSDILTQIWKIGCLDVLQNKLEESIRTIFLSVESNLAEHFYKSRGNRYNFYHLFSVDFMLDSELNPWLVEVNAYSEYSLRGKNKVPHEPMVAEILNVAGYNFPPYLSRPGQQLLRKLLNTSASAKVVFDPDLYTKESTLEDLDKMKYYENAERDVYLTSILNNLTRSDIKQLILAEDEFNRLTISKRIFPTRNMEKYISFIQSNKYYYKLLDAWETKYGTDRKAGRQYLQECITAQLMF